jgi:hypothetical protein
LFAWIASSDAASHYVPLCCGQDRFQTVVWSDDAALGVDSENVGPREPARIRQTPTIERA